MKNINIKKLRIEQSKLEISCEENEQLYTKKEWNALINDRYNKKEKYFNLIIKDQKIKGYPAKNCWHRGSQELFVGALGSDYTYICHRCGNVKQVQWEM